MLLIHGDQKRWADVDEPTMRTVIDEYFALDDALAAAGAFVDSAPLAPPAATKTVDESAAVDWAKQVPGLRRGLDHVEVRAIVEVERA
jgi:hypothetical protein